MRPAPRLSTPAAEGLGTLCGSLAASPILRRAFAMRLIARHLLGRLAAAMILISAGLALMIWLSQALRLADLIVNRGLPLGAFAQLVLIMLPALAGVVLPVALFLAVLVVYHRLIASSEAHILAAAGLSPVQLAGPVLLAALATAAAVAVCAIWLQPLAHRQFRDMRGELAGRHIASLLRTGSFIELAEGITVFIRAQAADGELSGILVQDDREPDRPVTLTAERGRLRSGPDGGARIELIGGSRQELDRRNGRFAALAFDRYAVDLAAFLDTGGRREPRERLLGELLRSAGARDEREADRLRAEGHQRLALPLYAPALALLGYAALMTGPRSRLGQGRRVTLAVLVAVALEGASLALRSVAARSPGLVWLIYLVPLASAALALAALGFRPALLRELRP